MVERLFLRTTGDMRYAGFGFATLPEGSLVEVRPADNLPGSLFWIEAIVATSHDAEIDKLEAQIEGVGFLINPERDPVRWV